jgi:hypothetical protein
MILRNRFLIIMLIGAMLALTDTAFAFFDDLLKSVVKEIGQQAIKKAIERPAPVVEPPAPVVEPPAPVVKPPAAVVQPPAAVVQMPTDIDPSKCKKGQKVNPYYLMLQDNFLTKETADMGDAMCVSVVQLKKHNERYIKQK